MNSSEAMRFLEENDVRFVDIRFTDLMGTWQHFSLPAGRFSEDMFTEGLGFDGSSIRGFQTIDQSDMLLIPDPETLYLDSFNEHATAVFNAAIEDPITRDRYSKDPRYVAHKCQEYLKSTGIGDICYFGPEAEFFLFDRIAYENTPESSWFQIDSAEAPWNSGGPTARGSQMRTKGGYFPVAPVDQLQDVRSQICENLEAAGIEVELHHHEVGGAGQCEIDLKYDELLTMADKMVKYKYIVKCTAHQFGLGATFMPKPLFGDNGSGMHCHQSIWKGGENVFYDSAGYAGLSDEARWYIGGLLKHAPALLAFTNPTTNSYRRLVPGYEAPINLIYSLRNRSACVRIPMYSHSPGAKRVEFRAPDPTANPYLAFAAMTMAGLDGIQNRIDPPDPIDKDLYDLPPAEKAEIETTPGSLRQALGHLNDDHAFLMHGDVFTEDLLDSYIDYKMTAEVDAVDLRPHPYEFFLYADA